MADINVERKGPSIWPWIVGLIVLALLAWLLMSVLGDDEVEREGTVVQPVEAPATTP